MPAPTPPSPSVKQRILRQAVAENVSTLRGELRTPPVAATTPATATGRGRRLPWVVMAVVPAAVAVALLVGGSTPAALAPEPETSPPPAGTAAAAGEAHAELDLADLSFPAPPPDVDARLFPLAVRRVVLDPGHGGDDMGTIDNGMAEKDLTLDIAQRLGDLLVAEGLEVVYTRTDDHPVSLRDRAEIANEAHADAFVSIHINWIAARGVRGVETYLIGPTDDPHLAELARRENRDSGYSLADMRRLLEGIYVNVRQAESRQLAEHVQRSLFHSLRKHNPGLSDRGVKTAPFVVLVATEMPAILAEVSCLSNAEEAELLARPLYRAHIAEALHRGVASFVRDVNQIEEKGS